MFEVWLPTNGVEKHQAQRYPEQRVDHGEEPPVHGLGRGVAVTCSTQSGTSPASAPSPSPMVVSTVVA